MCKGYTVDTHAGNRSTVSADVADRLMKKRWFLPFGVLVLLLTPIVLLVIVPGSWLIPLLESTASSQLGRAVTIAGLNLELLSRTPAATLADIHIADDSGSRLVSVEQAHFAIDASALLGVDVVFDKIDINEASLRLRTNADGKNSWQELIPGDSADEETIASSRDAPVSLPAIAALELNDITIDYRNDQTDLSANVLVNASGSTQADDIDTSVSAVGKINGQAMELNLETDPLQVLVSGEQAVTVDARLSLGDTLFTAVGDIGDLSEFRDPDLMLSLESSALDDLAELIDVPLPVIPPYRIAGNLKRDGEDIVLDQFNGEVGDSDMEGDIRLDATTAPVTLYANIISRVLDLDDLAGIVGAQADKEETPIVDERLSAPAPPGKLLPDKSLDLNALAGSFTGAIEYQAVTVQSPVWPIDSIDIRIEVQPERLVLSPANVGLAGGRVKGSLDFELDQLVPAATVEAQLTQVELRQILAAVGIDDDSFGNLGGRLKFWMEGQSVGELAASVDGGIFLLMTGGRLDALLAELAGIDLVESITLLLDPEKTRTDIRCAYLDLHADDGKAEFNQFVIDTDDTVFLADGSLNFNDETLDLVLEPHPKDVSLVAAQTAVNINGSFTEPTVVPGKALATRAAVAGILAAIASPAAALLPFVQPGTGQDSPFCDGLVEAIDDER